MDNNRILVVCTTDSMIWNFLVPHIKRLEAEGYVVECACSETGPFFEDLKSVHGLVMHRVDFKRSPYSLSNLAAFRQLKRIVRERGIHIIFCHEPVGGAMGRLVGHMTNCKVVYMAHGFHFYKGAPKQSRLYYYIEKFLARYTDILITINQEDYEASLTFKAGKKYLLPGIGIDTSRFVYQPEPGYIRSELHLGDGDIVLLSVGELIKRKNHETVIEAVAGLNDPRLHYVIAGDGELMDQLREKIRALQASRVHLLGYRKDIGKLCNSADIFIMPSFQEGLSVALMEAMACGLPIIASEIRGNVDLLPDERYGILVKPTDVDGYRSAICQLLSDAGLRSRMGRQNMERVKLFDIKAVEDQLLEIIKSLH